MNRKCQSVFPFAVLGLLTCGLRGCRTYVKLPLGRESSKTLFYKQIKNAMI